MEDVSESLAAIRAFLAPVLSSSGENNKSHDLVDCLFNAHPTLPAGESARRRVLRKALQLMLNVHNALIATNTTPKETGAMHQSDLLTLQDRQSIYALLDLICLKGIRPFISPDLSQVLQGRSKSDLSRKAIGSAPTRQHEDAHLLLAEVVEAFSRISGDADNGIGLLWRDRALLDTICGCAELAFSPEFKDRDSIKYGNLFSTFLANTSTSTLLPVLTSLLQPSTPTWLRPHLATPLSLVALRPNGVRSIIEFVASSFHASQSAPTGQPEKELKPSEGPPIPQEALVQITKLLSSVPSSVSAEDYFPRLAPQLLDLLDGKDGKDLSMVAGYVIGSGILGRKQYGAPGSIGWILFVQPSLLALDPPTNRTKDARRWRTNEVNHSITPERELRLALHRLTTIVSSHLVPGLVRRLVGPIILPLWGLHSYAKTRDASSDWTSMSWYLLEVYVKLCLNSEVLDFLANNIPWDGPPDCTFAPGVEGGIEIHRRVDSTDPLSNILVTISKVDTRVDTFVKLLASSYADDDTIGTVFLNTSRRWLLPHLTQQDSSQRLELCQPDDSDPLVGLVNAKLVQGLHEKFKDRLSKSPNQILELVKQLLHRFLEEGTARRQREESLKHARYASLGHIVSHDVRAGGEMNNEDADEDSTEVISLSLSLLSTILSASDFKPSAEAAAHLQDIRSLLNALLESAFRLPAALKTSAQNILSIISFQAPPSSSASTPRVTSQKSGSTAQPMNQDISHDRTRHSTALTSLTSPLPPDRAAALSTLSSLITAHSPVIDVPATTIVLLNLLQDPEEYVYLHALRTLTTLVVHTNGSQRVMALKMIVRAFVDEGEEETKEDMGVTVLDWRLRIGEGLVRVLEELGEKSREGGGTREDIAGVVRMVADGMLKVAGRRGTRPRTAAKRAREQKVARKRKEDADKAWGGDVPSLSGVLSEVTEEQGDLEEERKARATEKEIQRILQRWEGSGKEEDIRIRTSALSVLGKAIEVDIGGLGADQTAEALNMSLNILALETAVEQAILRRAAVLVVLSIVKALDEARETGKELAFGLAGEKLDEVTRVMQWVMDVDGDELVRGHAAVVVEGLETWQVKGIVGYREASEAYVPPRFDLGTERLAGLSVDPQIRTGRRPKIEEVE